MKRICYSAFILFLCFLLARCGQSFSGSSEGPQPRKSITKVSPGTIIVDGRPNEWSDIEPLTSEVGSPQRGDSPPDIDLNSIKVTYDGVNLYFLLEAEHVGSGTAEVIVDPDGDESTGVEEHLKNGKGKSVKVEGGWEYVIKLTYSYESTSAGRTRPMLISQVEKFKKIKYGYRSELVFEHKDSIQHPSYVGIKGRFQELKIPLQVLAIKPPTDIAFLFVEGWTGRAEYKRHCRLVKATIR